MDKLKFKLEALKAIDSTFNQVEKLEQKRDKLSDSMKQKYDKQIAALNERKADMEKQLEKIENTSEENWEEVKEAFSLCLKHYKAGFVELGKLFK